MKILATCDIIPTIIKRINYRIDYPSIQKPLNLPSDISWNKEKEKWEFIGCTHIKEKNCGVKQAIEEGKISKERYNRFCKIYEELKQKEERKKW